MDEYSFYDTVTKDQSQPFMGCDFSSLLDSDNIS